jgi:predicted amidohydrolase
MQLRVAGAQIPITLDIQSNLRAIQRGIEFARQQKADILLTPEGALSGYTPHFDAVRAEQALKEVLAAAQAARLGLALGTCFVEPEDSLCYDQLRFYTPDGAYLGFHSKILTCGSLDDPPVGEINDYARHPLAIFQFQGIPIGGLVCNDLWANPECTPGSDPHLSQQLARQGARVIFHAVNGGRDGSQWSTEVAWRYHTANLQMRARAAGVWIVTVDSCAPLELPCSAPSGVIDPRGEWVCQAEGLGEHYFVYSIDLA